MKKFNRTSIVAVLVLVISLVVGFTGPNAALAAGPLPVNLLSTANFAILAESGITTTAGTSITGDIGVSPAAASTITGFNLDLPAESAFSTSVLVNGKVYAPGYAVPTPANLTTAVSDMVTAYNTAAGVPTPDTTNFNSGNLGGQTFAPGLHKFTTAVTIPTSVTLSGGASDVWIFQIAGDLSIASAGDLTSGIKVILSGGAQASNVFWQVGGPTGATLGAFSTFNGTILSATQVVMQNGAVLNGRALAQTLVTLIANTITVPSLAPTTGPVFVDDGNGVLDVVLDQDYPTIQAAIDAAAPGNTIFVTPGNYSETASGRAVTGLGGTYQFGLYIGTDRNGLTIEGVDASGNPITDASSASIPYITTNSTSNFGPSGIFVNGNNVSIRGVRVGPNTNAVLPSNNNNKTIEVIGDNFTLQYSKIDVTDGGSVYISDFSGAGTTVNKYNILNNVFAQGASLDIASGAGASVSSPATDRQIVGNTFEGASANWALVSFSGSDTGVPWFVHSIGGAVITGNNFSSGTQYIRARGTYDNSQFNWASYWNNNTFDKKVLVSTDSTIGNVQTYSYPNSYGTFNNVRRIGGVIQPGIDNAQSGDTINVGAGTYAEQLLVQKSLTLTGAGTSTTIVKAPAGVRNSVSGATGSSVWNSDYLLAAASSSPISVKVSGFTFDANNETHQFDRFTGVLFNNVRGATTISDAGLFNSKVTGFNVADPSATGIRVIGDSYLTVDNNDVSYTINGIAVYGDSGTNADPNVVVSNNSTDYLQSSPNGALQGIIMAFGASGTIDHNTLNKGVGGIVLMRSTTPSTVSNNVLSNIRSGGTEGCTGTPLTYWANCGAIVLEDGASNNTISNNQITNSDLGIWDSNGANNNTFTGNVLNGNRVAVQIDTYGDNPILSAPTGLQFSGNSFTGSTVKDFANNITATTTATNNWWGTIDQAEITAKVVGLVDFDPWYTNTEMTTLSNDQVTNATYTSTTVGQADLPNGATEVTLTNATVMDLSAGLVGNAVTLQSGVDTQPVVLTNSNLAGFSASIPDGTIITGPSGWTGTIQPPRIVTGSGTAPSGFSVGSTVIEVGSPDETLTFNNPVTLLLAGVTGTVGYKPSGSDAWVQITNACTSGSYDAPTGAPSGGECAISNGTDTKILTYHFTMFGSLVVPPPAPAPASGGGGGGGGGIVGLYGVVNTNNYPGATPAQQVAAAIAAAAPAAQPAGQVLGVATYNFGLALAIGSTGDEVTELQKRLTNEGVYTGPVTGYFGSLTSQAVKKFQEKYGISPVGIVGPQTRSKLNSTTSAPVAGCEGGNKFNTITGKPCVAGIGTAAEASASGQAFGAAVSAFARALQVGSRGDDVTALQNRLTSEGVYSGPVTGYFGPLTEAAVKRYQDKYGIEQVEIVGPQTRAQLNK